MLSSYLRALLLSLLFATPLCAYAQGSVSGRLTDGKAPVSYATVTILRPDSSVVNGDLSKDDGSFNVTPVSDGSYLLRVESIGFTTKFLTVSVAGGKETRQGNIVLKANATSLAEVSITGEKRVMELKVDKKIFNVEKNTTTAGGSATDVLQNVPSVSVDADGTVNLRGKSNVTILIDGKPATMLGSDVTSALQSLPAGSIESVEVITNPSARYDAQGTTGIINIVTKKDGRFGVNGNVSVGAGTRDKFNANAGITVKKGKWSTFLNLSARQNHTFNNVKTNRQDTTGISYYTYEHVPRLFNGSFNSIGATYDINKNNAITFTENVNIMEFGFRDSSDFYIYPQPEQQGTPTFHRFRNTEFSGSPISFSHSLDYRRKFNKKGRELNVDATYATTTMERKQQFLTIIDVNSTPAYVIKSNSPGSGGNSSLNIWADYVDPITTNGKLGIGFKSQFYNFNSSNAPYIDTADITPDNPPLIDSSQFTVYNYDQQIHAAYVNWSDQVDKFSYQAGLRVEDAIYDGTGSIPRPAKFHNEFLNLFPSAFVSYQLPKDQSIYINYSRRTNRPNFFQMMPFKDFSNPGTVSMGNPNILPEFINNIEVSYSRNTPKGHTYIVSTYFAQTSNLSERVLRPITAGDSVLGLAEQVGQLLSQPVNIASGTTYGVEGTARLQLSKIWDATLSGNFFTNKLEIGDLGPQYTALIANTGGLGWFGKVNSNLKLPKNFSLQLNGNYESRKVIAQGNQRESYWIDLAVKKSFWKNKGSLTINCSDVLKTRRFINDYTTNTYTQTIDRTKETRIGNISFTYRFGKTDNGKQGMGGGGRGGKREKRVEPPSDEDRGKNLKQNDDDNGGGGGGNAGGNGGGGQRGK